MRSFLMVGLLLAAIQGKLLSQNSGVYISSAPEKERAAALMESLENGVLIVRLHSDRRKVEELNRLANSPDMDEKAKTRFQKMLESTQKENRRENLAIMEAVRLNYDFSKTLFMYDTASIRLQAGVKSGYFLNAELEVDPSLALPDTNWMVIYLQRETPVMLYLQDKENKRVSKPFPVPAKPVLGRHIYTTSEGRQQQFFIMLSYNKEKQEKFFAAIVNNWNARLKKYQRQMKEDKN